MATGDSVPGLTFRRWQGVALSADMQANEGRQVTKP